MYRSVEYNQHWYLLSNARSCQSKPKLSLAEAISRFASLGCADPRDRIYGLAALIEYSQRPIVDYGSQTEDVVIAVLLTLCDIYTFNNDGQRYVLDAFKRMSTVQELRVAIRPAPSWTSLDDVNCGYKDVAELKMVLQKEQLERQRRACAVSNSINKTQRERVNPQPRCNERADETFAAFKRISRLQVKCRARPSLHQETLRRRGLEE